MSTIEYLKLPHRDLIRRFAKQEQLVCLKERHTLRIGLDRLGIDLQPLQTLIDRKDGWEYGLEVEQEDEQSWIAMVIDSSGGMITLK